MSDTTKPTPEQRHLIKRVTDEVKNHEGEYIQATRWFDSEFSMRAISKREEKARPDHAREFLREREAAGWRTHKVHPTTYPMVRILRASEHLVEVDDTALCDDARLEHYRRTLLVAALATDPDFRRHAPRLARVLGMQKSHWLTTEQVEGSDTTSPTELNRWWARSVILSWDSPVYAKVEESWRHALAGLTEARPEPRSTPKRKRKQQTTGLRRRGVQPPAARPVAEIYSGPPRTWKEADQHLITFRAFMFLIAKEGVGWTSKAKLLAKPAWSAPRASLYRVADLMAAVRQAGQVEVDQLIFPPKALKRLLPPNHEPKWASRATIRPRGKNDPHP